MTVRRVLVLLAAALAAIMGSMYLSSQRHLDRDPHGVTFLPGLEAQLDAITDIRLHKGSEKPLTSLHRTAPGSWVVIERNDYPADTGKIRRLLLALAEARIVEQKTSNPASYAVLGVEDPASANAGGTEVTLVTSGKTIRVIVGHPAGNGSYVRRAEDAASYSVEPAISLEAGPRDWIDGKLLDIPFEKIQSIRMHLADGTVYRISRLPPVKAPAAVSAPSAGGAAASASSAPPAANEGFRLDSVPPGREPADASIIAPSPTTFAGVPADDVAPASDIDFGKPGVAEVVLSDGSTITLTGVAAGDKHWIKLLSSGDKALNARTGGRAFEIAGYRYDALFRPLEQLLKPRPAKPLPAVKAGAKAKKPASAP